MPKLLALLKMKKGEVKTISCRGMIENDRNGKIEKMFTYLARNLLYSNVNFVDNGKKRKIKDGVIKNIIKPSCVIDYNKGMGVDKQDQLLSCFPLMRRCVKRYKKIFFYLLDIAVYNAYVLYSKITNTTKISIVSFCLNIAEELLEKITLPNYKSRGN